MAGAFEAAESLVAAAPTGGIGASRAVEPAGGYSGEHQHQDLDLVTARMMCSHDEGSDRSLNLFASIAERWGWTFLTWGWC